MISQTFLYQRLVYEVVGSLGKILLLGGPGMGKTTLLNSIYNELKVPKVLVRAAGDAKKRDEAFKQIEEWCKNPSKEVLLIDDLDHIYDERVESLFRDLQENESSSNIIATSGTPSRSLDIRCQVGLNEKPVRRFATASSEQDIRLNPIMIDSRGLTPFAIQWLNPWYPAGWKERAERCVQETLIKAKRDNAQLADYLVDTEEKAQQIVEVSGGHPSLLSAATTRLPRMLLGRLQEIKHHRKHRGASNNSIVDNVELELEHYLFENYSETILRALRWAKYQLLPDVFNSLLKKLSKLAKRQSPESDDLGCETVLSRAGLIRIEDKHYEIPCRVIQKCIEQFYRIEVGTLTGIGTLLHDDKQDRRVELIADVTSGYPGFIRWHKDKESVDIELTLAEWDVIRVLANSSGSLKVSSIANVTGRPETSIRSTLQRLLGKLKLIGLERMIVNLPGQGYLLDRQGYLVSIRPVRSDDALTI